MGLRSLVEGTLVSAGLIVVAVPVASAVSVVLACAVMDAAVAPQAWEGYRGAACCSTTLTAAAATHARAAQ